MWDSLYLQVVPLEDWQCLMSQKNMNMNHGEKIPVFEIYMIVHLPS
jgi:hypothetical protein